MAINGVSSIYSAPQAPGTGKTVTPYESQVEFADFLKESINQVNQAQLASDDLTNKLARGDNVDLHEVMIASQKAGVVMQTALEIRNKAVEAYQEMMRMQV